MAVQYLTFLTDEELDILKAALLGMGFSRGEARKFSAQVAKTPVADGTRGWL